MMLPRQIQKLFTAGVVQSPIISLAFASIEGAGGAGGGLSGSILLEDGSGGIALEDGSGVILTDP